MPGSLLEDLRSYWELPAVSHFCSLFRTVFRLIDFDIEDFEDALIVDTECAAEGGRSSLIVDILVALMKGLVGHKSVTLLNYNQRLFELLQSCWYAAGYGPNPLGTDKQKASFHKLPLYPKLKLLHYLCEWRLDKSDVESLIRDFSGEHLRVLPLAKDDNGITYWYFYGTRLFCEEESLTIKIKKLSRKSEIRRDLDEITALLPSMSSHKRKKSHSSLTFGRKKRRKNAPRLKMNVSNAKFDIPGAKSGDETETDFESRAGDNDESDVAAVESETDDASQFDDVGGDDSASNWGDDLDVEDLKKYPSIIDRSKPDGGGDAVGVDAAAGGDVDADFYRLLFNKEDDEVSAPPQASAAEENEVKPVELTFQADDTSAVESAAVTTDVGRESAAEQNGECRQEVTEASKADRNFEESAPSWDQPLLTPPPRSRWRLCCLTFSDWQELAQKYAHSTGSRETELYRILTHDFLPAIESLFAEIEKEKARKIAELAPRRVSDRLEVKRLQKEHEDKELAEREALEMERQAKLDEERQKRSLAGEREQRAKLRQLEREKRLLLRNRAKQDRSQRLEMRQIRQQLLAEGKEIPPELLNVSDDMMSDKELTNLDREIEMEHMYAQLEKIMENIKSHADAAPFIEPVSEDIAPNYKSIVEKPMDLETMEDKLMERKYTSKREFLEDFNLILLNCLEYNGIYSDYVKIAIRFERTFIKAYKRFFPPTDVQEFSEMAKNEELDCISILGALDRRVKEVISEMAIQAQEDEARQKQEKLERAKQIRLAKSNSAAEQRRATAADALVHGATSSTRSMPEMYNPVYALSSKADSTIKYCRLVDYRLRPANKKLIDSALPVIRSAIKDFPDTVSTVMIQLDRKAPGGFRLNRVEGIDQSNVKPKIKRARLNVLPQTSAQGQEQHHSDYTYNRKQTPISQMPQLKAAFVPTAVVEARQLLSQRQQGASSAGVAAAESSATAADVWSLPSTSSRAQEAIVVEQLTASPPRRPQASSFAQKPVCSVAPLRQQIRPFAASAAPFNNVANANVVAAANHSAAATPSQIQPATTSSPADALTSAARVLTLLPATVLTGGSQTLTLADGRQLIIDANGRVLLTLPNATSNPINAPLSHAPSPIIVAAPPPRLQLVQLVSAAGPAPQQPSTNHAQLTASAAPGRTFFVQQTQATTSIVKPASVSLQANQEKNQ